MSESSLPLDVLLAGGTVPTAGASPLDAALADAETPRLTASEEPESPAQKSRAKLRGENQALQAQAARQQKVIRVLAMTSGALALVAICTIFWARAQGARKLEQAFRIIHYRELGAVDANAVVLDDYASRLQKIADKVKALPPGFISDNERLVRLKACLTTIGEAKSLRDAFIQQAKQSQAQVGSGGSFQYIDPFLKRPVDFDDAQGGEVDLDKLRAEIQKETHMDEAMESMDHAMTSPVPLADQMTAEAKSQNAPTVGPNGVVPPAQAAPAGAGSTGLTLPTMQLPTPAPQAGSAQALPRP